MANALAIKTGGQTAKQREALLALEKSEAVIAELESKRFEEWVSIGLELMKIRTRKWYLAVAKDWKTYCRMGRTGYNSRTHADRLILAAEYRRALPDPEAPIGASWTESTVRPLTKLSSPTAAAAVAKAAIKYCEKNKKDLTATVVDSFVASALDTPKEKAAKAAQPGRTPAANMKQLARDAGKHLVLLKSVPRKFWSDANKEIPGCVARAAEALEELASLLRSNSR